MFALISDAALLVAAQLKRVERERDATYCAIHRRSGIFHCQSACSFFSWRQSNIAPNCEGKQEREMNCILCIRTVCLYKAHPLACKNCSLFRFPHRVGTLPLGGNKLVVKDIRCSFQSSSTPLNRKTQRRERRPGRNIGAVTRITESEED